MGASTILQREVRLTQNSYYEASVTRPPASPALAGRVRADVCVVGAGLAGLSAALELRARGFSVAIVEAKTAGWGASGRNGGQAIVGYASDDVIAAQYGPEEARQAWQVTVDALDLLRQRIATHNIDCDFVSGYLSLAVNARKARELIEGAQDTERRYGYRMQSIGQQEIGDWIASER
ncbi:MAG: NAD(P)/FAD-dependent oxidoreductase, partial [Sphingomonadaceae bacterium]